MKVWLDTMDAMDTMWITFAVAIRHADELKERFS